MMVVLIINHPMRPAATAPSLIAAVAVVQSNKNAIPPTWHSWRALREIFRESVEAAVRWVVRVEAVFSGPKTHNAQALRPGRCVGGNEREPISRRRG